MGRVCVFFAEGYEEIEALTVVDLVRRVGIDTDMVSVTGEKTVTGSHGISVEMDRLYAEVDFSEVDMLVLPGGMPGKEKRHALILIKKKSWRERKWQNPAWRSQIILSLPEVWDVPLISAWQL